MNGKLTWGLGGLAVWCGAFSLYSCSSSSVGASTGDGGSDAARADDAGTEPDAGSVPDAAGAPCDPVAQNCPEPFKCSYQKIGSDRVVACELVTGDTPANEGQACNRIVSGQDNCVKGTMCFPNGGNGLLACRKACSVDTQCKTNERCVYRVESHREAPLVRLLE